MRTHYCGEIDESLAGRTLEVAGWVHRRRDHGGVIFVDLRDREGLLQVVFDPDAPTVFADAERLRNEFVIRVRGVVRPRPAGTANTNLASGQVEVLARELVLLNRSEPLPFQLDEDVNEELRLKYRYLDLRRDVMTQRLRLRRIAAHGCLFGRRHRHRGPHLARRLRVGLRRGPHILAPENALELLRDLLAGHGGIARARCFGLGHVHLHHRAHVGRGGDLGPHRRTHEQRQGR